MSLTLSGHSIPPVESGRTDLHEAPSGEKMPGVLDEHLDGQTLRNAPNFGTTAAVLPPGRLDEVLAPEQAPAPEVPAGIQVPRLTATPPPDKPSATAPAVTA